MALRTTVLLLGLAVSACSGLRALRPAGEGHTLPLQRVRLYASGVGYFERSGVLDGALRSLPVPGSHLDDALTSLVLLSPQQGFENVSFPSRVSPAVARARAGLPSSDDESLSYDRLLASLRGELVEARARGRTWRGRIVEVVAVGPQHPSYAHQASTRAEDTEPEALHVLLLTDDGELLRFDAHELSALRPRDPSVLARLEAAVGARLALRSKHEEALAIEAAAGQRLVLGYLAEAPVWRASYRLLLDAGAPGGAALQAWALVHNDTDEPWQRVALELSNGEPESFLFPITAPRYERRELRTPARALSSVPQLSTTTADALWGDFSDYAGEAVAELGAIESAGFGTLGSGYGRGGGGFASGSAREQRVRPARDAQPSSLIVLGDLTQLVPQESTRVHAVSSFSAQSPLDLAPHHSALVPFIHEPIAARELVWFGAPDAGPERALAIRNDTHNALPRGSLAVFAEGGFVGQAELEALKPGERRFVRIGRDADTDLVVLGESERSEEQRLGFEHGALHVHVVRSKTLALRIGSRSAALQAVHIALDVVANATVEGADRLDYDGAEEQALAIFDLEPGTVRTAQVRTREGLSMAHAVHTLASAELTRLAALTTLPEPERAVLHAALPSARAAETTRGELEESAAQIAAVEDDVTRLREHARSLEKSESGAAQGELVRGILEREAKLRALRENARALGAERARREAALALALSPLARPGS